MLKVAEYERREEGGKVTRCIYLWDEEKRALRREENGELLHTIFPIESVPAPKDGMHPVSYQIAEFAQRMRMHHANTK